MQLRNIQLTWTSPEKTEWGSAIRCWHVRNLEIAGFVGRQALLSPSPVYWLKDVKDAFIYNCRATAGAGTIFKIEDGAERLTVINNEFSHGKLLFDLGAGIEPKEIFESSNHLPS